MIEPLIKDESLNVEQVSLMLEMDENRLHKLCRKIEQRGYLFTRNEAGTIQLTERDIMMILCFT